MKLENQVVSLELAKKLKELGVKQESYFVWYTNPWRHETGIVTMQECLSNEMVGETDYASAFTVAELGEMLPKHFASQRIQFFEKPESYMCWDNHMNAPVEYVKYADTAADARAKMLIYLIENVLVTV